MEKLFKVFVTTLVCSVGWILYEVITTSREYDPTTKEVVYEQNHSIPVMIFLVSLVMMATIGLWHDKTKIFDNENSK